MRAHKIPFDTLQFANRMKAAGMEPKLAEEQAEAMAEVLHDSLSDRLDHLVTQDQFKTGMAELRAEIAELRSEVKTEIAELRAELKTEIAELRAETRTDRAKLRTEMAELKSDLIKWMVSLTIGNTALLGTLIALMQFVRH